MSNVSTKTTGHLSARARLLRQRFAGWKVDALLVTNPADIRYLTGFVGDDSWALVLGHAAVVHILSDFRFEEQIQREAPQARVHIRKGAMVDELARVAAPHRLRKIALQADYVTLSQRTKLAAQLGAKTLVAVDDGLLQRRAVKDESEISAIRKALAIQEQAFRRLLAALRPGMAEQEVAAQLEFLIRSCGAEGVSFPSIVAADANASLPHAIPGRRKLKPGGIVLIDWGARYQGYCSDLTRVIALGKMPGTIREIYQVVLDAQCAAIAAIRPGQSVKAIDAVARDLIKHAGYGDRFGHGLGHGIGLAIHEQPTLSFRGDGVLQPGHVVTVEPGIYLPGIGGVRIEDDVLVTPTGGKVLSHLPKDLNSAII